MIRINNNIDASIIAYLYCPAGEFIGRIENYQALLDVRRQIKEKGRAGYHIIGTLFDDDNETIMATCDIKINENGKLYQRPDWFFTSTDGLLTELI